MPGQAQFYDKFAVGIQHKGFGLSRLKPLGRVVTLHPIFGADTRVCPIPSLAHNL